MLNVKNFTLFLAIILQLIEFPSSTINHNVKIIYISNFYYFKKII